MKRIITSIILISQIFLLVSCNIGLRLITENYSIMKVYKKEELVFKTDDSDVIEETIKKINRSRRDSTRLWEIPESIGEIRLIQADKELILPLYEDGGITIDEYYVFTDFNF